MASIETAVSRGRRAEQLAESYLIGRDYRIIKRNHRCAGGEVDLIAWDGPILCFIEVRARSTDAFGTPLETIDRRKIGRIIRASRHFLNGFDAPWPQEMRFDAVGILLDDPPDIVLVTAAFEA